MKTTNVQIKKTIMEEIEVGVGDVLKTSKGIRQVVGGKTYGTEKYFTVDFETGMRKSRVYDNLEDVLEGYEIEDISVSPIAVKITLSNENLNVTPDVNSINVGKDILVQTIKHKKMALRRIGGGMSYGEELFFTYEPTTGRLRSNMCNSLDELLEGYNVVSVL